MNFGGRGGHSGNNASGFIPDASNTSNEAIWATEEDYRNWNAEPHNGSEQPPSKKTWSSSQTDSQLNSCISKSKTIGKMFFKTKLCCKFRAGTCPYITNCNFAHGMQELRPPPPNWQELVADCNFAHGMQELCTPPPNLLELVAVHEEPPEPREENQIPILTSSSTLVGEGQRPYKGRHCKKFYTEEGCPYGDMCTFMHDEQSKARESVVISLSPSVGGGGYGVGSGVNGPSQKPSNWKTRICNKWEMTGQCPFGSKCHFAHGAEELHRYGGGLAEGDGRDYSSIAIDTRQGNASSKDPFVASTSAPHQDVYHMGVASQRTAVIIGQRHGQRSPQKWKGPDKISRIYGDWIGDFE